MSTGVMIVEGEVRELIRQRGVNPSTDVDAVNRLIDEVTSDYLDRSVTAALPPLGDIGSVTKLLRDSFCGYGLLQPLLDDETIEEIWINEPGRVFIARRGRSELTTIILTADQVDELVERMLRSSGRRIDLSTPFVDAMLPDGSRLHVVIPQITRAHVAVNIRKFVMSVNSLDALVSMGSLSEQAARFLEASVVAGLNILVAGGTQAGKTTMLNALCAAIPARERVVTVEEVFELQVRLPDVVPMQTRQPNLEGSGEIVLRRLVKEALRMRPSRLVVGEVRHEESLDLLIALNSGLPGMCTVHANSAREALVKMCTLPLLAGENISAAFVVPTVAASIDLVVHLGMDADGRRSVREIVAVTGRVEADAIETSDIFHTREGRLERAEGFPPHPERYERVGVDLISALGSRRDWARVTDAREGGRPGRHSAGSVARLAGEH
jgi:pilus assembly protein CpaF